LTTPSKQREGDRSRQAVSPLDKGEEKRTIGKELEKDTERHAGRIAKKEIGRSQTVAETSKGNGICGIE